MKKYILYIFFAITGLSFIAGCNKMEEDFSFGPNTDEMVIAPFCKMENSTAVSLASGKLGTKSLINQTTSTDTILCNFIKVDENADNTSFPDWSKAYISEGTIATIPSKETVNADTNYLRAVSLYPELVYPESAEKRSRMVGWYPRNCDVPENLSGNEAYTQVTAYTNEIVSIAYNATTYTGVKFTGLDGSVDVMVSNVKEGSKNANACYGKGNFFTFKHYLSAVRVYAKAERSSQDIGMWGEISEVVVMGQPSSCIVALPETEGQHSEVVEWGTENAKFPIRKEYLFGENETGNPDNIKAEEYPIALSGTSVEKYLGYSLIRPNSPFRVQVHTVAGVYNVEIPAEYNSQQIFQAGYIYDIHIDFKTDGTIFAYLETEGTEKYYDLTKGSEYKIDSDGDGDTDNDDTNVLYENRYSNCYIINSAPTGIFYDGYCFDATVIGNGDMGIISNGAQTFYPTNAHISPFSADVLWETSPRLVTNVELMYGYVRFKVAKDPNDNTKYKEGNAVIAVYDNMKKILWSWHIWITDKPQEISYTEESTTITILDRNIGATFGGIPSNAAEALESYGMYYQWGRKDPSMGPPSWNYHPINMITAPYYDYSSDEYYSAEVVRKAAPTLQDAVENPMYLIMPTALTQTYYFNWLYEKNDFLWGYSPSDGTTHKTIYDPCPYGYRVSGGELGDLFAYATSLSTTGANYTLSDYGQTVTVPDMTKDNESYNGGIFFPYSGYKGVDRGLNSLVSSWKYVGQKGDYQSAIVSDYADDKEYYMHRARIYLSKETSWNELNVGSYTGRQIQDHTNRRTAAPVRCVSNVEQNFTRLQAFITPDKTSITDSNSEINFKLFAKSFGNDLSTAKLYLAYHPLNNDGTEGEHREVLLEEWNNIGDITWECNYSYNFSTLTYNESPVDLKQTTGNFRFFIEVKTVDNINRISSTSITLSDNNIGFESWLQQDSTLFIGQSVNREIRLYGDATPVTVQMIKGIKGGTESDTIDITVQLRNYTGNSTYQRDYLLSIDNISFDTKGWNYVYFKVTYDNGATVIYNSNKDKRWFKVTGMTLRTITDVDEISDQANYVIKNNGIQQYLYDNGDYMKSDATPDYNNLFKFIASGSGYKIQNVNSGHYVSLTWSTLYINATNINSVSDFNISINNGTTLIYRNNRYYWNLANESSDVNTRNNTSGGNTAWTIYEVEPDTSDISGTPYDN